MSWIFSNCTDCKHFKYEHKQTGLQNEYVYTCKAFPEGIPRSYMFRKEQDISDECSDRIKFEKE